MSATQIRFAGFARCSRSALLCGTALRAAALVVLASGPAAAQLAPTAHPTGGTVVGGQAGISQTGNTTLIRQSSQSASINWQNFDVGSQASVNFQQPGSGAIALNRVVGPDPSEIAGHITANGQVVIVNQSGVVFDQGSQVDTAGLVVSASGISDHNFAAGHMVFDQAPHPGARVVNNGTITIRQAGLAALVAPQVGNNGLIQAQLGRVVLAGAATYTLDLYGDGLLAINVTGQVTNVTLGGRTVPALVTNMGTILADGGTIMLTAQAADGLIRTLVSAGGTIAAQSVGAARGRILAQGIGGSVEIDGAVSAPGSAPGTQGGQIEANATGAVTIGAGANLDASGSAGGGLIAIGTTAARAAGGPHIRPTLTASSVSVARGARIAADATEGGDGGRITLLSTGLTSDSGALSVLGGASGGNGGFTEVSGETVALSGLITSLAPHGRTGSLLIDPASLLISDSPPTNLGTNTPLPTATLAADLVTNNISMSAAGDIDFLYTHGGTNHLVTGSHSLTLVAGQSVNVDNGFQITGSGGVTLTAQAGAVTFGTSLGSTMFGLGANDGTLTALQEGSVNLGASAGIALGTATVAGTTSIALSSTTSTIAGTGPLTTPSLSAVASTGITLTGLTGTATTLGSISTPQGNITIDSDHALAAGDVTASLGNVTLSAASLSLSGTVLALAGAFPNVSLTATTGDISGPGAVIHTGTLTASAPTGGANIDLSGNNILGTVTSLTAGGNLRLVDTAALVVDGTASGAEVSLSSPTLTVATTVGTVTGTSLVALQTDTLTIHGTVTTPSAGIVALDLYTPGTLQLEGDGGLIFAGMNNISTGTLAVGSDDGVTASARTRSTAIAGTLDITGIAASLGLFASTGAVSATAADPITAGTLYGAAPNFGVTGANKLNALGTIAARTLSVKNAQPLTVDGTDTGTVSAAITSTGLLTIASGGSVSGAATLLKGSDLDIAGSATGSTALTLTATTGTISEAGSLATALLTGSAAGTASLIGNNSVTGLGSFTASGFTLDDAAGLSVSGVVNGTGVLSITTTGTLSTTAGGATTGGVTTLSGTDLNLSGSTNAATSLLLTATGTIAEAGSISTPSLGGSAVGTASLTGTNTIGTLTGFTANGFALKDGTGLQVTGTVNGTGAVAITDTGTLTLATSGSIAGSTTTLGGDALALGGTITAPTSLSLTATTGTISAAGSLSTGLLIGSAHDAADFAGTYAVTDIGSFTAAGFTFTETGPLHVTGAIDGGTASSITSSAALSIDAGGSVTGTATSLTGTSLAIAGSATGSATLTLTATSGTINETGTLSSTLLTGSATGAASLTGSNSVTGLGGFTAAGFTLDDAGSLDVTASVNGTATASITTTGPLTVNTTGIVTASATTLSGSRLTVDGTAVGTTSLSLTSTAGTISAPGTLSAGTLTGSAATIADLEGTNTITHLGDFTANNFIFVQTGAVDVTGAITAGTLASLTAAGGDLTIEGSLAAGTATLSATNITLAGTASLIGTTALMLATTGTITAAGSVTTALLTGSATGSAAFTGPNSITGLGNFTAFGLTLLDSGNLQTSGSVDGTSAVTISDTGPLTIGGSVNGGATALTATTLAIPGTITAATTLALTTTGGDIGETGQIFTPSLTVSAQGAALLSGTNSITALAASSATGAFTLSDGQPLTVAGPVSAGDSASPARLLLSTPTLTVLAAASLTATGGTIALQADTLTLAAPVSTGASGVIALDPLTSGATLSLSGVNTSQFTTGELALGSLDGTTAAGQVNTILIDAPLSLSGQASNLALFTTAVGTISQSAPLTIGGTLTGMAGTVTLTDPGNSIGALGNFTAAGGLTYSQAGALLVSGAVSGGPAANLASGDTLALAGSVNATSTTLSATNLSITGTAGGSTNLVLIATTGTINETGTLNTPLLTGLAGQGATLQGTTNAGTDSNAITSIGSFTAPSLTLTDGSSLRVAGTVTAATALALSSFGSITETGSIATASLSGTASSSASLTGSNTITTLTGFAASGFALADTGPLSVTGSVTGGASASIATTGGTLTIAPSATVSATSVTLGGDELDIGGALTAPGTLTLNAGGAILADTATLAAGTLAGSAGTQAAFGGSNTVGTIGAFTAGTFTFSQPGSLTIAGLSVSGSASVTSTAGIGVTGSVTATDLTLSGGNIDIAGSATGTNSITLSATAMGGTITETGSLTATLLSGTAPGTASLTGSNSIGTLLAFNANGFALSDTPSLTIAGSVNGTGSVSITDTAALTLAAGGSVFGSVTTLSGAALTLDGTLTAPASLVLSAGPGGIGQTGTLNAASLSGTSTGAASFTGADSITTLGSFTAAGFAYAQGTDLDVAGPVDGGVSAGIASTAGLLDVTGSVTASATSLFGANLNVDAGASATGLASLTLTSLGSIAAPGALTTHDLTGSAGGSASLSGGNSITGLSSFTAAGLALNDIGTLTVSGAASGGTATTITDAGTLSIGTLGSIAGDATTLTALSIGNLGTLSAPTSLSLTATAGGIASSGTLITNVLSGSATGSAGFTGDNLVTDLGTFTADQGFGFAQTFDLDVTGAVSGGPTAFVQSLLRLTIGGSVAASTTTLSGANLDVPGSATGTTSLALTATAGSITELGALNAGLLTGSATGGGAALSGTNSFSTLGSFTAAGLTIADTAPLMVSGSVSGTAATSITDTGSLTVSTTGTIAGDATFLSAAAIAVDGTLHQSTTLTLSSSSGITEGGSISTSLLTGSATGAVILTSSNSPTSTNLIANIGSFTAQGITIEDTGNFGVGTIGGSPNGGPFLNLSTTGLLSVNGSPTAQATSLTGSAISITGTATGSDTLMLTATGGSIDEPGALVTNLLSGSATGSAALTGTSLGGTSSNTVTGLGTFTSAGFTLVTAPDLLVTGVVNGHATTSITDDGTLTAAGGTLSPSQAVVLGTATALAGDSLVIDGSVTGTATLDLVATGVTAPGTITEPGSITTTLLTGSAFGSASFTGSNVVGTLGSFSANPLIFHDAGDLTIGGTLTGTDITLIVGGTLTVATAGSIGATTVLLAGSNLALNGKVDGSASESLTASNGTISETGTLMAGSLTGTATGAALLSGTGTGTANSNSIGTLGSFTAASLLLNDAPDLSVAGPVRGAAVAITDGGTLSIPGTITAPTSLGLVSTNGAIAETGGITTTLLFGSAAGTASFGGTDSVTDLGTFAAQGFAFTQSGDLHVTGAVTGGPSASITSGALLSIDAPGSAAATTTSLSGATLSIAGAATGTATLSLIAGGGGLLATGALDAGLLTGSSGGTAGLSGTNSITALGTFTARGFGLQDTAPLTLTGLVNGIASVAIGDTQGLSVATTGTILGTSTTLSATTIGIAGAITAPTILSLTATGGGITETGSLTTGLLTGSATGTASFGGADAVTTLGSFTAQGFAFTQGGDLIVGGPLNGGTLATITAGNLTIPGTISAGALNLAATATSLPGTITESGGLTATILTGSAQGSAALNGGNLVGTLASFSATGFTFTDGATPLSIAGPVAGGPSTSIADGGTLTLSGSVEGGATALTGQALVLNGTIAAPDTLSLVATQSGINAPGGIDTGTLTGAAAGPADFTGSNSITHLAGFTAAEFTLRDGIGLTVDSGIVNGGTGAHLIIGGPLLVLGSISGTNVDLIATDITIPGSVTGSNTLTLTANTGTITETGSLATAVLTGSAAGSASLTGSTSTTGSNSNAIAAVLAFNAIGFTLADNPNLQVTGPINGGPAIAITDAGTLGVSGSLSGGSVSLTAAAVNEAGSILAGLLTGSAAGSASLTGSNTITDLGTFAAQTLTLNNAAALTVTGAVTGGPLATLTTTGLLTVSGSINASAVDLTAPAIAIPGSIDGTQSLTLTALAGTLSETGHLTTGLLTGAASGSASLVGGNSITTLGGFSSAGFTLADMPDLAVDGPVTGGTLVSIADTGTLSIGAGGSLTGTTVSLTAAAITEAGSITAGTLTGSTTGNTTLTGTNQIGALADVSAANLILTDLAALSLTGTLSAGTLASITDSLALSVSGSIAAPTVALTAASIDVPGAISAAASLSLIADAGAITEAGSLSAPLLTGRSAAATSLAGSNSIGTLGAFSATGLTLDDVSALEVTGPVAAPVTLLQAASLTIPGSIAASGTLGLVATSGTIAETGQISAGLLTGTSFGSTSLAGTGNLVGALSDFTAQGFALTVAQGLEVTGTVSGGASVGILAGGALAVPGSITGNLVSLTASSIDETGAITAPGTLAIVATNGSMSTLGSVTAGVLTGSATGNASFTGSDQIATLGDFTASGLTLLDATALSVAGAVIAPDVALNAAGIDIPGSIAASGSLSLVSLADIAETGSLQAGLLSGTAAGSATLTGPGNSIATLGSFSSAGLVLDDASGLTITGPVTTGTGALTAASFDIAGSVTGSTSLSLLATTGGIGGVGTITTPALTLSATGGVINLTGSNAITALNGAVATGISLNNADALSVTGSLTASSGTITVAAPDISLSGTATAPDRITFGASGTITLANGTLDAPTILLGGTTAVLGQPAAMPPVLVQWNGGTILTGSTIPASQSKPVFPKTDGSATGIFVQADDFRQSGSTLVNPRAGSATVFISLDKKAGTVTFSPDQGAGLIGPSTQLFLDLNSGGIATGQVVVAGLSIDYIPPAAPELTNLGGTIGGLGGQSASGRAYIIPVPDSNYRFNACAIGSVNCVLLSPVIVPIYNPTVDVTIDTPHRKRQDDDLIIPNVGEEDF